MMKVDVANIGVFGLLVHRIWRYPKVDVAFVQDKLFRDNRIQSKLKKDV